MCTMARKGRYCKRRSGAVARDSDICIKEGGSSSCRCVFLKAEEAERLTGGGVHTQMEMG
jgi:hypothetical protein